jgi:starvation-inducible DNA-binding protein
MNTININQLVNQYVADSMLLVVKLHNIHWNVVGNHFMKIHNYTEELYNRFFETYDGFAEALKIKGESVFGSLADYTRVGTIQELGTDKLKEKEALEVIAEDLEMMHRTAKMLRHLGHEQGDVSCTLLAENEVQFLEKQLWFIRSMLEK